MAPTRKSSRSGVPSVAPCGPSWVVGITTSASTITKSTGQNSRTKKPGSIPSATSFADKTQEWVQTAQSAANKAADLKKRTAGIMQQTGEQVMNMVQGALDRVKNTLGINETTRVKKELLYMAIRWVAIFCLDFSNCSP